MDKLTGTVAVLGVAAWLCGCGETGIGARDVRFGGKQREGRVLSQAELQQDVQRFAGQFMDNVVQAAEPLARAQDLRVRQHALRRVLIYESTVVDIASGSLPELNVLDLLVFITLSRNALERYWNPQVFGEHGAELLAAFEESERDLSPIAAKLLSPQQRADLRALVRAWEQAHPNQHRVEAVRFIEFSALAGQVSIDHAKRASGLLSQVKAATQAADQALLLGDRALFLAQRMPFLVRAQARLGVQETLSDTLDRVGELEAMFDRVPEARQLVGDLAHLTSDATGAAREARLLLAEAEPLLAIVAGERSADEASGTLDHPPLQQALATAERLTDKNVTLLRELRALAPEQPGRMLDAIERRGDRVVRRWIGYLVLLGAAWALLFWGGYLIVKRLTADSGSSSAVVRKVGDEPARNP